MKVLVTAELDKKGRLSTGHEIVEVDPKQVQTWIRHLPSVLLVESLRREVGLCLSIKDGKMEEAEVIEAVKKIVNSSIDVLLPVIVKNFLEPTEGE